MLSRDQCAADSLLVNIYNCSFNRTSVQERSQKLTTGGDLRGWGGARRGLSPKREVEGTELLSAICQHEELHTINYNFVNIRAAYTPNIL